MSRAQLIAGAVLLGAVAACGSSTPPTASAVYGAPVAPEDVPAPEAVPTPESTLDAGQPSTVQPPVGVQPPPANAPMYGMPPR
jgi:hypothetical protein